MGKGGGCVPSKSKAAKATKDEPQEKVDAPAAAPAAPAVAEAPVADPPVAPLAPEAPAAVKVEEPVAIVTEPSAPSAVESTAVEVPAPTPAVAEPPTVLETAPVFEALASDAVIPAAEPAVAPEPPVETAPEVTAPVQEASVAASLATAAAPVEVTLPEESSIKVEEKKEALVEAKSESAPEVAEVAVPEEVAVVAESVTAPAAAEPVSDAAVAPASVVPPPSGKTRVFIIYYSMYGHVAQLAKKIKEGVDSVDGVEGLLFQVPETLNDATLSKLGAPPKDPAVPIIDSKALVEADGFILGFPTRFGMMAAQMKSFLDSTGGLWQRGALTAKPAGIFFSTGTQGGGQEMTALSAITQLAHHGLLFVPIGYTFPDAFSSEVHGGSPYGTGTYAGDGSRMPSELELNMASHQGKILAIVADKLKKGGEHEAAAA